MTNLETRVRQQIAEHIWWKHGYEVDCNDGLLTEYCLSAPVGKTDVYVVRCAREEDIEARGFTPDAVIAAAIELNLITEQDIEQRVAEARKLEEEAWCFRHMPEIGAWFFGRKLGNLLKSECFMGVRTVLGEEEIYAPSYFDCVLQFWRTHGGMAATAALDDAVNRGLNVEGK